MWQSVRMLAGVDADGHAVSEGSSSSDGGEGDFVTYRCPRPASLRCVALCCRACCIRRPGLAERNASSLQYILQQHSGCCHPSCTQLHVCLPCLLRILSRRVGDSVLLAWDRPFDDRKDAVARILGFAEVSVGVWRWPAGLHACRPAAGK